MQQEEITVMTFGTFDFFHAGHESYLKQAKQLGTNLIVIIARDKTVKQIKGNYPSQKEKERLKEIKKRNIADKIILGDHKDKYKVIKKYKPEIIALGYDQFAFTQQLKKIIINNNLNTKIIRLNPHKPEIYKSSIIKNNQKTKRQVQLSNKNYHEKNK